MKAKALRFGKAMSAALFVLLLSVVGMKNALAQNQMATLQHGDEMTAYYGMNALVEAHNAATSGDIITLSSGHFTNTTISKAITLHGAGCDTDTLGITPTIVSGDFVFNGIANTNYYFTIEGISFHGNIQYQGNLNHARFIKCRFNTFTPTAQAINISAGNMGSDVQFINCSFDGNLGIRNSSSGASFINCLVKYLYRTTSPSNYVSFNNSYIHNAPCSKLYLLNCIVAETNGNRISDSYAYNCIEIDTVFSSSVQAFDCMVVNDYSDVFESFDGSFSIDEDFHLKDEVATSFLGNDGREVGIYGGAMPYNLRPSYLILNRCNVANKSTIDGKLSVDIEVISNGGE